MSIGELAQLTGVPVRTIRFYCDNGVLESVRSSGGHRMFDSGRAAERLLLVRRLRTLGVGLPAIGAVLTGEQSLADAVAAERAAVDVELDGLAWRRACLRAIENADPAERAARLELLANVQSGASAYETLVGFWRRVLTPVPSELFDGFLDMNVPGRLHDPTPEQVVAYAELVTLVIDRQFGLVVSQQLWRADPYRIPDRAGLIAGVGEACGMAETAIAAGVAPSPGPELDRFVGAHAAARATRDTPGFRARLATGCPDTDPRTRRYWQRAGEIMGASTTAGAGQRWLFDALARTTSEPTPGTR
ncbi:MerR family transcriptional regulator [Nocardia sp. NBC_01503]|uniref:MerR family transcriptional regulator n=1 Tax=Nocardia sp. NBC_01503 TaxID=2975997 RepID=UPI002E7BBA6B|nr:MerR family transcriptional regulator [Nocardia sp. NBC_01503]WTL30773.1 MerR family transcriptional regulator [Nocardia sp. NBC_01503]